MRRREMRRRSSATGLAMVLLLEGAALAGPTTLVAGSEVAPGAPEFGLRDGDRVVFYGDSITQDGGYARLVEEYAVTRFPGWDLRFYNAGVGGDTVKGGWAGDIETRLERDVVALRPTVVTIMLGMNDGGYKPYDPETFSAYAEGYRAIVSRLQERLPGVRLTLVRPSPFDDVTRPPGFAPGYDDVLRRYGCYVTALGARDKTEVVDFREPLNEGLAAVQAENPALARQLLPDRVHPSEAGHLVLGAALLRAWRAPAQVTRVVIDAASTNLVAAEGTTVERLEQAGSGLRWTQTDEALPLPLNFEDADVALAEQAGAGLAALDQQPLVVTGLPAGDWAVRIEGTAVGTFSAEALAAGVNLATRGTPMRWQAYEARWGASDRHEVERVRRRILATAGDSRPMKEAADALATLDEQLQRERKDAVQPRPRTYEVVPAADSRTGAGGGS